jgi:hypothetical protein
MPLRGVPVKCMHTPQAISTAADRFSKKRTRMQPRCKAAASRNRQQSSSAVKLQRFTAGGNADRQHMKLRRFTAGGNTAPRVKLRRFTTGGDAAQGTQLGGGT